MINLFKKLWQKTRLWFEEIDVLEAIRSGKEEERTRKLKPLSRDLHELLD